MLSNDTGFCSATISAATLSYPTVFDACGIISSLPNFTPAANYVFPVGVTIVTWTVIDAAGNSASADQTVTVTDDEAPVITCPGTINVNTTAGSCDAVVTIPDTIATDNCATQAELLASATFVATGASNFSGTGLNASGTFPLGTTTLTFTVTDAANLTATCSVDIIVSNPQAPLITLLGDNPLTIEACDSYVDPFATGFDSCLGDITADIIVDDSTLNLNIVGTYTITYNLTNAVGVSAIPVTRTVIVEDTTLPTLLLVEPLEINIGICSVYTELGATAQDPCFGDISSNIIIDNSAVDTNVLGTYIVTYNLTDDHGNATAEQTRTVNVIDVTGPEIVLLGDNPQIIEACTSYMELGATAIDPCSLEDFTSNLIIDASTVDTTVVGTYTVTYNAEDDLTPMPNAAIEVIRTIEVVDTTAPVITLNGDNPQIIEACTPYVELGVTIVDCSTNSTSIDDTSIDTSVEGSYTVTYTVCDVYGNCSNISRTVDVVNSNPTANAGADFSNTVCTDTTINLSANLINGTDAAGLWTVTSGQTSGFSFLDATNPITTFTGDTGETYTLTWTITGPCGAVSDDLTATFINCSTIDFDGVDDNITFKDNYNLNSNFTIEIWIKSEVQNNAVQTIFSKRDVNNQVNGYDLRVVDNYVSFNWNNGESMSAPHRIKTNQWHHIAVTNNNGTYILYIDGVEMNSASGSSPLSNSASCLIGAMAQPVIPPFQPENYFDGGMDELRLWNVTLTADQIRKMMNQEIENTSGSITGITARITIPGITWSDLTAYYKMNQSTDLTSGNLTANNGAPTDGVLRNMTTLQAETAPIPYRSTSNGIWTDTSSWLFGSVQAIPNSVAIDNTTAINWNIVTTSHAISSGDNNITVLGLSVNTNELTIENNDPLDGQSIRVTDYLKIDGTLALIGESQLLQDANSIVDYLGTGNLKRDQQGTSNLYNYNYWSSPVGTNGSDYQLNTVLYDGTQPVIWTSDQDAIPSTTPTTMSRRWLYTYENFPDNSYADWQSINENDAIGVGLGFLMKGSGAATANQNYTFVGQPNNAIIATPITANYSALVGNPYPSAIDAHEFISDNSSSIQGTIYYWEHYDSNVTHVLEDYEGGYAAYNLSGGNPAVSPPEISGQGTSLKIPERYIPVGQGFFVQAGTSNGQVTFENDQRVFVKEAVTGSANNGSVFMRTGQDAPSVLTDESPLKRLRIYFRTPEGAVRPLLLAFTPNNEASDDFDFGYDAINTENFPNDMSWQIHEDSYIIQGVGEFDATKMYPLGLFMSTSGSVNIGIDRIENFDTAIDVFVYDIETNTSVQINDEQFSIDLENTNYVNRFYITFQPTSSLSVSESLDATPTIMYLNTNKEIYINLPSQLNAKSVDLYNMVGQLVRSWQPEDLERIANEIRIPTEFISEGMYIVKLTTNDGRVASKKMIIKY
jgi:hypothetical protein